MAEKSRGAAFAKASWVAFLLVIGINVFLNNAASTGARPSSLIVAAASLFLYSVGLVFGVLALARIGVDGRQGVLAPAVVGVVLNGGIIVYLATVIWR